MPAIPETGNVKGKGQDIVKLKNVIMTDRRRVSHRPAAQGSVCLSLFSPRRFDTQKKL
jgi:hypothetical protein